MSRGRAACLLVGGLLSLHDSAIAAGITPHLPARALIVGDSVRVRDHPSMREGVYVGVFYMNMLVVAEEASATRTIDGVVDRWYRVHDAQTAGWVWGRFLTFAVPDPPPDPYAASSDFGWFKEKFGDNTGYQVAGLHVDGLTPEQYRKLMAAALEGEHVACQFLAGEVYPYLQEHPSDPGMEYVRRRLYDRAYIRTLLRHAGWHAGGIVTVLPPAIFDRGEVLGFLRDATVAGTIRGDVFAALAGTYGRDREVVLAALPSKMSVLAYASEELKDDLAVARRAVVESCSNYAALSERLRDDRGLLRLVLKTDPCALNFASDRLKADREFAKVHLPDQGCECHCATGSCY